jgi:hypothetical protein
VIVLLHEEGKETNFMELSPSWEAANHAPTQELSNILWNLKVRYRVHMIPPLSLSWAISIQSRPSHPISLRSISILSTYLRLRLTGGLFPSGFPTNILYAFLFFPIRATCHAHLRLLDLIIPIYLAKSTSYEAHHYAVFFNLLSLHLSSVRIFSSALSSQAPSDPVPLLMSDTKFHTHITPTGNIIKK